MTTHAPLIAILPLPVALATLSASGVVAFLSNDQAAWLTGPVAALFGAIAVCRWLVGRLEKAQERQDAMQQQILDICVRQAENQTEMRRAIEHSSEVTGRVISIIDKCQGRH